MATPSDVFPQENVMYDLGCEYEQMSYGPVTYLMAHWELVRSTARST
jgi:hypothetical protein